MTETTATLDRNDIPDENSVPSRSFSRWRIASGEFRKGREIDGSLEVRSPNKIVGKILAFRVFTGEGDKGNYTQLEVDVLTRNGMEYIKVDKNVKEGYWPTQGVGLAKYLTVIEEGKTYVIEPQIAKKANSSGSFNTFVDVGLWNAAAGRVEGLQTDYDGEKFADIADDVFEALEAHPLYKEREAPRAEDEKTEYDFFEDTLEAKGFPSYKGNESAWLKVFNRYCDAREWDNIASIGPEDDTDADYWTAFREDVSKETSNPIAETKKGPKSKAAAPEEYDPFADD